MDYRDFVDVEFLASLADGTYFNTEGQYDPEVASDLSLDPLSTDAPTPVAPQDSASAEPEVAAGGLEAEPVAEAPVTPEPAAAPPAASAPAPQGADALFENESLSSDPRADEILGG